MFVFRTHGKSGRLKVESGKFVPLEKEKDDLLVGGTARCLQHPFQVIDAQVKMIQNASQKTDAKILVSMDGYHGSICPFSTFDKYVTPFFPTCSVSVFEEKT